MNQSFATSGGSGFWTRSADMRWNHIFECHDTLLGACWRTNGASYSIYRPLAAFRIG